MHPMIRSGTLPLRSAVVGVALLSLLFVGCYAAENAGIRPTAGNLTPAPEPASKVTVSATGQLQVEWSGVGAQEREYFERRYSLTQAQETEGNVWRYGSGVPVGAVRALVSESRASSLAVVNGYWTLHYDPRAQEFRLTFAGPPGPEWPAEFALEVTFSASEDGLRRSSDRALLLAEKWKGQAVSAVFPAPRSSNYVLVVLDVISSKLRRFGEADDRGKPGWDPSMLVAFPLR